MATTTTARPTTVGATTLPIERPSVLRRVLDSSILYRLIALAIFASIWEWYATTHQSILVPTFGATMLALPQLLASPELWDRMLVSNQALVLGFALALAIGIPTGLLIGRFRPIEQFANLYINILLVLPMAAILPIVMMAVGIRDGALLARVILVFLFAFVMLIVNSRAGVRQVDPSVIEMSRCFGASELQIWRRVLIPGSIPAVMAGVRIGLGRAVLGMVIVELLLIAVGLGNLVQRFEARMQGDMLYALVIIIVAEALLLIQAARWLERKVAPWRQLAAFGE
jgi:NitT/TauT family transport system permease protein